MNFRKPQMLFLILCTIILTGCVYWFYWHLKPFTANAFVFADTRPVTPLVDGYITHIYVRNNQFVKKGEPLFTVYTRPYQLKTEILKQEISATGAKQKKCEAEILRADAEIRLRKADLDHAQYLFLRAQKMYADGAVSGDYQSETLRNKRAAEAMLEAAKHRKNALQFELKALSFTLEKLKHSLALSQVYLAETTVRAENDGYVTNMTLSIGGYYRSGDVLFGFIDTTRWYLQANFKESELSEIREGVPAKIWLRQYPGKFCRGVVTKCGWGVERRFMSPHTGLPEVRKENEWFLLPQRFPVQIRIEAYDPDIQLHPGASAYVELDIPSRPVRQFFWELFLWE
ncbi:MAG: HlyD family secretion protein [Lentisphaeria bacterium]|nr:HlyD family secretion protein [Lentisphaeria bacterium]